MTHINTRTFVRYFSAELVDERVGDAYKALAWDLEKRRGEMPERIEREAEGRLELLRLAWQFLLDPVII